MANCKTDAEFNSYIASEQAFYFNVFYTNTLLNKDQLIPTQPVFEDKLYLKTSNSLGIDMNMYISEFNMETDNSLYPWEAKETKNGLIVDPNEKEQWNYIPNDNTMTKVYFRKSDNKVYITRSFRKIDDMLSYIGGLFGIIAVLFGVLMTYYSQCSFELSLSENIFEYREDDDPDQNMENSKID